MSASCSLAIRVPVRAASAARVLEIGWFTSVGETGLFLGSLEGAFFDQGRLAECVPLLEFAWELEVLVTNGVDGSAGSLPVRAVRFTFGAAWANRSGEGLTVDGNRRVGYPELIPNLPVGASSVCLRHRRWRRGIGDLRGK